MKVIFLDIDGVLNILSPSYRSFTGKSGSKVLEKHLLSRLQWLINETGAGIVLSSSWDLKDFLKTSLAFGFDFSSCIVGRTPRTQRWRGDQIKEYLDTNQITNYVVIEDEPADVCGEYCNIIPENKVVDVDMKNGLTHHNLVEAVNILEKD